MNDSEIARDRAQESSFAAYLAYRTTYEQHVATGGLIPHSKNNTGIISLIINKIVRCIKFMRVKFGYLSE